VNVVEVGDNSLEIFKRRSCYVKINDFVKVAIRLDACIASLKAVKEAFHYAHYLFLALTRRMDSLMIVASVQNASPSDFSNVVQHPILGVMHIVESDETSSWHDSTDVIDNLLSLSPLVVISVGDDSFVQSKSVSDLHGESAWPVRLALDVVILNV